MSATGTERAPWLCRTCAWGFPESIGYSCSHLEGHICSHVVVACEEYRRRHDCSQEIPKKGQTMSTSDERREVAEKLRHASHTDANLGVTIAIAILDTIGEVHRPIAAVVADLIDEGAPVACPYCGAKVADDGERGDDL